MRDVVRYQCRIGAHQYKWQGDKLVAKRIPSIASWCDPFSGENAVFVEFADLEPTREAILVFANKYGSVAADFAVWKIMIAEWKEAVAEWIDSGNARDVRSYEGIPDEEADRYLYSQHGHVTIWPPDEDGKVIVSLGYVLDMMRLQFFVAATTGARLARCAQCGKPFLVFIPTRRSTRVYCSRACNTAAYRDRHDKTRTEERRHDKPKKKGTR